MLIQDLLNRYIIARWAYAVGKPIMSDIEYNEIDAKLKVELPDNEYVNRVWSEDPCPLELLTMYGMEDLYKDISIQYGSESMSSLRSEEEVEDMFRSLNEKTRVSYKVDGWNNQVNYYNGKIISVNTRGRSTKPKESNVLIDILPKTIPMMGIVKIIGEASIPNNKWKEFQSIYGGRDQRASVSTVIAKMLPDFLSFKAFTVVSPDNELDADKYKILNSWGFETPKFMFVSNYKQLLSSVKMLSIMDDKNDVLTDGLVVENSHVQIAMRIGKWQESSICSYVTKYIENPTPYGVSMTLGIKPIDVGGKKISILDITNISQIVKNNLRIGYPVAFAIRSSSNPAVNMTKTAELQEQWFDNYEEYREMVDSSSSSS